jgi:aspartyl-tRNA(Asn)/glutamyl-tRNA(Gln) amidotransferase subunit B
MSASTGFEAVIGLEVHAQLRTESKLFSGAPNRFGAPPNSQTAEVDLGLPGTLPVLNERAVALAVRLAVALGCRVEPVSRFARKHYFYPDLPKGYQISQYEEPYARGGGVPIRREGALCTIPLVRIHMEEDAGKSIHDDAITGAGVSHVDLNRAGVPLVEIVSEPALRAPEEAGVYLRSLRSILRALEVSDADMEKGHFRCDANVSVRRCGETELGTKVELKNLNSFRFVERAIAHEIERQIAVLAEGGRIVQETRHWDERAGRSRPGRDKENADDYRYFPEPDLIPLTLDPAWIERVRGELPELPLARCERYRRELGLPEADAERISEDRELWEFFEGAVSAGAPARTAAHWVVRELREAASAAGGEVATLWITPRALAELLSLLERGEVTAPSAREIFGVLAREGGDPAAIMRARGLQALSDASELEAHVEAVIQAHPAQAEQVRSGDEKVLNFLLGLVMKRTGGKASPKRVRELLGVALRAG